MLQPPTTSVSHLSSICILLRAIQKKQSIWIEGFFKNKNKNKNFNQHKKSKILHFANDSYASLYVFFFLAKDCPPPQLLYKIRRRGRKGGRGPQARQSSGKGLRTIAFVTGRRW